MQKILNYNFKANFIMSLPSLTQFQTIQFYINDSLSYGMRFMLFNMWKQNFTFSESCNCNKMLDTQAITCCGNHYPI